MRADEVVIPVLVFSIPILAIGGGIVAGIVRTVGRQRIAEMAYKERIAAVERGLDPSLLPPPPFASFPGERTATEDAQFLVRVLTIVGLVMVFGSAGLAAAISRFDSDSSKAILAAIPMMIGWALLLGAWIVRPRKNAPPDDGHSRT